MMKQDKLKKIHGHQYCIGFLLIILFPIFLLVPLLIMVNMGRPVFFAHQRSGFEKQVFSLFKFRTMREKHGENITRCRTNYVVGFVFEEIQYR